MSKGLQKSSVERPLSRRHFLGAAGGAGFGLCASLIAPGFARLAAESTGAMDMKLNTNESSGTTGWVSDDRYLLHKLRRGHPESPERLRAILRQFKRSGLEQAVVPIAPEVDPLPYIRMVHSGAHLEAVARQAQDEAICRLAVSGALSAVDAVCAGKVKNAFCAIRPPGHHAANNGEFGFCFYNNVAIAARYAQERHGLAKILIVDWDYHHGDGTEWAFYEDPTVLTFSTHALHAFPGTGAADKIGRGPGEGFNFNVPLPRGAGDRDILRAFDEQLIPAADNFRPDMILISAGFDARMGDPLGDFTITDEGFAKLTELVMSLAETYAGSRIVSLLEGGYNTEGLALAVDAHLRVLLGA